MIPVSLKRNKSMSNHTKLITKFCKNMQFHPERNFAKCGAAIAMFYIHMTNRLSFYSKSASGLNVVYDGI